MVHVTGFFFQCSLTSQQRQEDDFCLFGDEQLGSVNLESVPPSDAVLDHDLRLIGLEVVALSSGYEVDIIIFMIHPQICKLFLKIWL